MSYAVVRKADQRPRARSFDGYTETPLVTDEHGSLHMEVSLAELAPGASVPGHFHPFEESFFVLEGDPLAAIGSERYRLAPNSFGFAPLSCPHAWHNPGHTAARWLRVRAPGPRRGMDTTHPSGDVAPPSDGRVPDEQDPRCRYAGTFAERDLGSPGPLSMPGYHGSNIVDISIRMMVDDILGALHHTLFVVQFDDAPTRELSAKEHYHAFEEAYYLLTGATRGVVDGDEVHLEAGDLVWTGVGATHGFVSTGDEPLRWLEVQSPTPPPSSALMFPDDWAALPRLHRDE